MCKRYAGRGLFARRGLATDALRDVSFQVRQGETIGLLGPNGAGKTTLLKIIATLLYPTAGRVLLHGTDVLADPVGARGMMGLVTCDERSFYWRLTGQQNLNFFATLYGVSKQAARQRSAMLLETLGLTAAAQRPYHTYSSGMKQKLAIARGLLADPRLVLYDEPTRSLDPLSTQNIRNWIAEQRSHSPDQTHVIATNQLAEAEQLCDRVVIINRGMVIAHGTIAEVRQRWHRREYEVHRITCQWPTSSGGGGREDHVQSPSPIFVSPTSEDVGHRPLRAGPSSAPVALDGLLQPDPDAGLLAVEQTAADDDAVTLQVRVAKSSDALSQVLARILQADGRIIRCELQEVPFDEVFCSLVLGDSAGATPGPDATPQAAARPDTDLGVAPGDSQGSSLALRAPSGEREVRPGEQEVPR